MSTNSDPRVPTYRHHKPTGQAVVTLAGRDIYLGKHGTAKSRKEYRRIVSEWLAQDRSPISTGQQLLVLDLIQAYWQYAKRYYVRNGQSTGELYPLKLALRPVKKLYGHLPAQDFGPLALKAVRQSLIDAGNCRTTINGAIGRVRRMFRWATAEELLPVSVYQALATVDGLRAGCSAAKEPKPILPVTQTTVDATLPLLQSVVADMVRFQQFTGCRPSDVCLVRPGDIDTSDSVWIYRPAVHKTQYLGRERIVFIGPKAQNVLRPYLLRAAGDYCFSPAESEQKRRTGRHAARVTPLKFGNRPGTNRRRRPKRAAGARYSAAAYRRAIARAVELANRDRLREAQLRGENPDHVQLVEHWAPNQLRHAAGTEIRRRFGLEAAQVALGHAHADVTEIYAERNISLARQVMQEVG